LCLIVGSLVGGWLYARRNTPAIGIASIAAIAIGLALLGQIGANLPFVDLFPLVALIGAGLGLFTAVNNTAVMSSVGADQRGFASGLVETTRQLGHSLGVSISSGVLQTTLAAAAIPELGYRDGFSEAASTMGLVSAIGVVVVLYPVLKRREWLLRAPGPHSHLRG
jgi:predicted MFS family arabinose efflux permease